MTQNTKPGFQVTVNNQPGVGQPGDFADANLRTVVISGPGGFIAAPPPRGPIVGNFAWGDQNPSGTAEGMQAYSNYQGEATAEIGFVHREQNTTLVKYLDFATEYVQSGFITTLYNNGGFWALFAAGAAVGQKVFALYADGSCVAAATGTSTTVATSSAASLANTGVLTVGGALTGAFAPKQVVTLGGQSFAITSQLTGTVGGAGTYQTSLVGTVIGGAAATAADRVETAFIVDSPALAGEVAKITTWG